ncbi:SNARE associated Golgi protein [uncultured Clostridium sp.]|nr:SNARE associated Golgi protein [uncultured Clostridium sp.]
MRLKNRLTAGFARLTSYLIISPEERARLRGKRWLILGVAAALIAALLVLLLTLGRDALALAQDPRQLHALAQRCGIWGWAVIAGFSALQAALPVVPASVIQVAAGFLYGAWPGALLCLVGIALGSALLFFFVRKFGTRLAGLFIDMQRVYTLPLFSDAKRLNLLLYLLFLVPGTPKTTLVILAGLTPCRARHFLPMMLAARLPAVLSTCFSGQALGQSNYWGAGLLLSLIAILTLAGAGAYRHLVKREVAPLEGKRKNG